MQNPAGGGVAKYAHVVEPIPAPLPEAAGLSNLGVTCWWNSVVQTMLSLSCVRATLQKYRTELGNNPVAVQLLRLIDSPQPGNIHIDLLQAFLRGMEEKNMRPLSKNSQQCANEGLIAIIDVIGFQPFSDLFRTSYSTVVCCVACNSQFRSARNNDRQCYMYAPVPVGIANRDLQYRAFVSKLHSEVQEVDEHNCPNCGPKTKGANRIYTLIYVSNVIIVHFMQYGEKKDVYWHPREFRLPRKKDGLVTGEFVYSLRSQMHHSGSLNSGHHWAVCERSGGVYALNDTSAAPRGTFAHAATTHTIAYELTDIAM